MRDIIYKAYMFIAKSWFGSLYKGFKVKIRSTAIGRVADRFIRLFFLTAAIVFVTNWSYGHEVIPLITFSVQVGFVAALDKLKNELTALYR